jgi:uncharacterized protein (DUF2147 family)
MWMMKFLPAAVIGLSLLSSATLASVADGTWLSDDGGTKVRLADCGGRLCGTVVWLHEPTDAKTGQPKTDKHNPDPAKRARPLLGLQVAQGMTPSGPNTWSGQIYNADDGHSYQVNFSVESSSRAKLVGCVLGVLCKGHTWTRSN